MNLDEIIQATSAEVRDTATNPFVTSTDIVRYANDLQLDLAARLHLLDAELTGTTTGATIPIPVDFLEARSLRIGTNDFSPVDDETFWSRSDLNILTPAIFRVFGATLELWPSPGSGQTYKLRYWRKPVRLILGETAAPIATTSGSAAAEIATFNLAAAHNLAVGDWVDVAGVTPTAYNGRWRVLTVVDSDTFTAHIGSTPANISVQGTVEKTDVPEIPEELHQRLTFGTIGRALLKVNESEKGAAFIALYNDGLPPLPDSKTRVHPGPLYVTVEPNAFDLDIDARHF